MIDWHSHFLPGMDDGSRDVKESTMLLKMQAEQGVHLAIATPHFYANDETVDSFLDRRRKTYEELEPHLSRETPKVLLGAEVRYYQGISRMADLKKLCIQGSKVLLLEMPMCRWTEYMLRELLELADLGGVRLMLAHVERYLPLQNTRVWDQLLQRGVLMQVNAGFFESVWTKAKALALLRRGNIHALGSDCHSITARPPEIDKAYRCICRKLGEDYLRQMDEFGQDLLEMPCDEAKP